jgi:carbon monoxide dehydrogenase subunit G
VRARLLLTVAASGESASTVSLESDLTVTGRVAQFGRGAIQDVSRRLMSQMGQCIGERLQAAAAG